jgi:hypothetical protein
LNYSIFKKSSNCNINIVLPPQNKHSTEVAFIVYSNINMLNYMRDWVLFFDKQCHSSVAIYMHFPQPIRALPLRLRGDVLGDPLSELAGDGGRPAIYK